MVIGGEVGNGAQRTPHQRREDSNAWRAWQCELPQKLALLAEGPLGPFGIEQFDGIASRIGDVDRLGSITMRLQFAMLAGIWGDKRDVWRMLFGNDQRQFDIGERQQGPGRILVGNFAAERFCVPSNAGGNVLHRDGHMVERI